MLKIYEAKLDEAKSMMNTQTPEQARQMYEQALALAPDDYFLHGNFERFLEKGGYLAQAIAEAKRCCELVPQLPGGYYYTGTLLVREGKITEAADYFSRAHCHPQRLCGSAGRNGRDIGESTKNRRGHRLV